VPQSALLEGGKSKRPNRGDKASSPFVAELGQVFDLTAGLTQRPQQNTLERWRSSTYDPRRGRACGPEVVVTHPPETGLIALRRGRGGLGFKSPRIRRSRDRRGGRRAMGGLALGISHPTEVRLVTSVGQDTRTTTRLPSAKNGPKE